MVKGVAGEVVTPFSRLFKHRAEQTGILKAQHFGPDDSCLLSPSGY